MNSTIGANRQASLVTFDIPLLQSISIRTPLLMGSARAHLSDPLLCTDTKPQGCSTPSPLHEYRALFSEFAGHNVAFPCGRILWFALYSPVRQISSASRGFLWHSAIPAAPN
jgi:hypothetical protein